MHQPTDEIYEVWTRHGGQSVLRHANDKVDAAEAVAELLMKGGGKFLPHSAYYSDISIRALQEGQKVGRLLAKWSWDGPNENWNTTVPAEQVTSE